MAFEKLILEQVAAIGEKEWKVYDNGHQKWSYADFEYRCDKWEKSYRALYTRPKYEGQQGLLEFARPDNIIVTNLSSVDLNDECLIYHHHQRGADELPHRGLKEFGSEQMPFKRFGANQAFYYLMVIAFFLFETFKEDNLQDIVPISSYATTVTPSADRHGCKGGEDWRRDHLESPQSHHGVPQTGYPVDALPTGATGSGNIAHAQQSGLRSDRARIPVTLREHKTSQQQSTALRKITIHPSA